MDILDIDEALKDDSFIFLADKTHDDVSNILQQWKTTNGPSPPHQQQTDQAYKLNSKTFTRPKRKLAQSLETQFSNTMQQNNSAGNLPQMPTGPMLNLEIGGLVTNMHKSFLQDTSPPSSICSSMEASMDRMNNSLISSADFTNLNFLQSTQSLDYNAGVLIGCGFDLSEKATADGYTLNDMIRDRKALESLTMSGDGTLIKDSQIAQIDDISLTLSKTASGCSTMDNSTDSVGGETINRTIELLGNRAADRTLNDINGANNVDMRGILQNTMVLSGEMIGETTFNLVENSMHASDNGAFNTTHDVLAEQLDEVTTQQKNVDVNETFKKPSMPLDETVLLNNKANTTFECQNADLTPDARCETPENVDKKLSALRYCESTPQTASVRHHLYNNKQQYTPSIKMVDDVNISPIIATSNVQSAHNATRVMLLNNTYEPPRATVQQLSSETFSGPNGLPQLTDTMELLENVENPNETYNKTHLNAPERVQSEDEKQTEVSRKQMQCVMDLAEAEVEMLTQQNDEEQFEHMLDELGRVKLNAEQVKIQKSLDSIKKRFNYSGNGVGNTPTRGERELSREAQDMRDLSQQMNELMGTEYSAAATHNNLNATIELKDSMRDSLRMSRKDMSAELKNSRDMSNSGMSSQSSERLLSRRSRLYDDVNLSMLSSNNSNSLHTPCNSTSFTLQKDNDQHAELTALETEMQETQETEASKSAPKPENVSCYKLAEKRERDRDRFKTIKITKQRNERNEENEMKLDVPCIDDDDEVCNENDVVQQAYDAQELVEQEQQTRQMQQRLSRRDRNTPETVFNNNKSEVENPNATRTTTHSNYLTYKKPKDKLAKRQLPEILTPPEVQDDMQTQPVAPTQAVRQEPRSLSRPRYISGLQKFTLVSKATSAGDLQKTTIGSNKQLNATINMTGNVSHPSKTIGGVGVGSTEGATSELKSPMGIKSKSFHNLSSNFGSTGSSGMTAPRASMGFGLKKLNATAERQNRFGAGRTNAPTSNAAQPEKNDETLFKVPKLVAGLRAPNAATTGLKRGAAGLTRPSSGYYSLNVTAKETTKAQTNAAAESEAGRHSPTESLSSASSRGSLYSVGVKQTLGSGGNNVQNPVSDTNAILTAKLTQVTTGASGIPKPSGLRPPSNIKRSGLPRPSSIVRR